MADGPGGPGPGKGALPKPSNKALHDLLCPGPLSKDADAALDFWGRQAASASNSLIAQGANYLFGTLAALGTTDNYKKTFGVLLGGYIARVIGPFSPRTLPRDVARIREDIRFDPPHHGKGWHWDGKWFNSATLACH